MRDGKRNHIVLHLKILRNHSQDNFSTASALFPKNENKKNSFQFFNNRLNEKEMRHNI